MDDGHFITAARSLKRGTLSNQVCALSYMNLEVR